MITENKTENNDHQFVSVTQYCIENFNLPYTVWKNTFSDTDRNDILSTYKVLDTTDYSKVTDWLLWERKQKIVVQKRRNQKFILIDYIKLNEYVWSIDEENSDRIKPLKIVNKELVDNPLYIRIDNIVNKYLAIYVNLKTLAKKLVLKGYRFSYGNIDKSVSVVHANGKLVNYITNELYDNLESYIGSLPISKEPIRVVQKRVIQEIDFEYNEKKSLEEKESLEQALKAYNNYTMYKLSKNGITEDYRITDENDLVIQDSKLDYDLVIPTESIEFDTEILDGSNICRKGNTFLPIYVLHEEKERELPIEEKIIKITKNGSTILKSSTDFKVKKRESVVQKTLSEKQRLNRQASDLLKKKKAI